MELCNIPSESPTRTVLPAIANNRGYAIEEEVAEVCPVINLPHSFDQYLDSLDSKQRRELNRKLRRAEAAEVTTTVIGHNDDLHVEVENFLDLLQKSTFEKRDWLNEGRRALFHEVAQAAHEDGTLQLMSTSIEGRRAAALFNFDHNQRIWVYNSGLDPAAFPALSPGVVLTVMAIQQAIELGRQEFDFLRGDEEYKYRFGAQDTKIYRLRIARYA
jgi:CelD/BcsL family acetyltransferase involved in cellulose biosynthesis